MKKLLQLFVLALMPAALFGQSYSFTGTVTSNGAPVPNAAVCIFEFFSAPDTLACTLADENGLYSFENVDIPSNDSVFVSSTACPNVWYSLIIAELDGSVVDIDCGGTPPVYNLVIGSYMVNEESATWYFVPSLYIDGFDYTWTIEGQTYTSPTVEHSFASSGVNQVDLTVVTNSGETYSASLLVYVNDAAENCEALFFQYGDSLMDGLMYFANSSLGSNLTYLWDFGDGNTSEEAYPVHTFADDIAYTVCLTITGDNCEDTYCMTVNPEDDGSGLIENGEIEAESNVSSKSAGFQFIVQPIYTAPVSTKNADAAFEISLFPNPSTGSVNFKLDLPVADNGAINVTDLIGKLVYQESVSVGAGAVFEMNFDQLPNGVYLVQYQGKLNSKVLKMAIQR